MEGLVVSSVAKDIKTTLTMRARRYRVLEAMGMIYEVFSTETMSTYVVRLDNKTCTCYEWQASGIPCGHALAVSLERNDDPQTYAKAFFQLDAYRGTYENPILPPNVNAATTANEPNVDSAESLLPPIIRCPPGRPRKLRIRGLNEGGREKRAFRCARCGSTEHSRRTCKRPV